VPPASDSDDDDDGLTDYAELCGWGTLAAGTGSTDSDADGLGDCREVMDVNGNGLITNGDATLVQQAFFSLIAGDRASMDVNRNAVITNGDATLARQAFFGVITCL
jgi:hypothetical protein